MNWRAVSVLAGAILMSCGAAAAFDYGAVYSVVPRPSIITLPKRVAAPDEQALRRAYPPAALAARVNGAAVVSCLVKTTQELSDCAISWESPTGYGFGDAARSLASLFRYEPGTEDGRPVLTPLNQAIAFDYFPDRPRPPKAPPLDRRLAIMAGRGSPTPAPEKLAQIQLLDGRLVAVARYAQGDVAFVGLDDQQRSGDVVQASVTNVFAYSGESLPVFKVRRMQVDCRAQTVAYLGERFFDHRGRPDGWQLSEDEAPTSATFNQLTGPVVGAVCLGPNPEVTVAGIDEAIMVVKGWPDAAH